MRGEPEGLEAFGSGDYTHTLSRGGMCVVVSGPRIGGGTMTPDTGSTGFVNRELVMAANRRSVASPPRNNVSGSHT